MASDYYANISGAQSCSSSRWLTEEVFKLIDMVQHDEAIYNPRHKYYFCRPYVETFWREVDQKLEKNPGASLAKWTNLRISFRREYTNYLEEKVPPCWTYFDRMFFLHPYLRKKHSTPKSIDSQVQDALVRSISSLSNRLHRERTAAVGAVGTAAALSNSTDLNTAQIHNLPAHQNPIDNYLEYFDDPEQNNSDDLDDVMDEEQQRRLKNYRYTEPNDHHHTLSNDIKSECDDVKSDVDEYEPESGVRQEEVDNELLEEMEMRNFMMDSYASSSTQQNSLHQDKRAQLRMHHLMRLQARACQEEIPRIKRPRSQESISSSQMSNSGVGSGGGGSGVGSSGTATSAIGSNATNATSSIGSGNTNLHSRMQYTTASTAPIHANVSLVRPTLAKPVELVSTTSNNGSSVGLSVGSGANTATSNNSNNEIGDLNASSTSLSNNSQLTNSSILNHNHQLRHHHPSSNHHSNHVYNHQSSGIGSSSINMNHHRLEFASIPTSNGAAVANNGMPISGTTTSATLIHSPPISNAPAPVAPTTSTTTTHMELCDCKTDPDAMFLMSLLPDIQKLNGRDRGKIKIAFQNILQDYLYPD